MLTRFDRQATEPDALERVRTWTREQFRLPRTAPVFVAEVACALPGCPPLETVVGFWTEDGTRHHFKVFKRVDDVVRDDLPPGWLIHALVVDPQAQCDC